MHWERMLEDGVEYLDLNPRTVHNQAYFASLQALDSPNGKWNKSIHTRLLDVAEFYINQLSSLNLIKYIKIYL